MKNEVAEKSINIFNLYELEDLPSTFKKKLKSTRIRNDDRVIFELFNVKPLLSLDEIMVGFYRLYHTEKERAWFIYKLRNLSDKKLIRKVAGTKDEWEKI